MDLIFKTSLQKKLLTYVFTHPDDHYYVRELAELIDVSAGNLSKELTRCSAEGLFTFKKRGNLKLYTLNKSHPLFSSLKEIIFKTSGVEGALRDLVSKYKHIKLAILHGSFAKNTSKTDSDIDLIIIENIKTDSLQDKFLLNIKKLEEKLNREINFTCYNQKEFETEKDKKGSFLSLVLKGKMIILKGELNEK